MATNNNGSGFAWSSNPNSNNQIDAISDMIKLEIANSKSPETALLNVIDRFGLNDKLIVFFGFQGLLANTFSLIEKTEKEEVKMKCMALDDRISPVFMDFVEFYEFFSKYNVPEGTLNPVKLDDALSTLRIGANMNRKDEVFEDSDVDEFDDNCNDDCIPGNHSCKK